MCDWNFNMTHQVIPPPSLSRCDYKRLREMAGRSARFWRHHHERCFGGPFMERELWHLPHFEICQQTNSSWETATIASFASQFPPNMKKSVFFYIQSWETFLLNVTSVNLVYYSIPVVDKYVNDENVRRQKISLETRCKLYVETVLTLCPTGVLCTPYHSDG